MFLVGLRHLLASHASVLKHVTVGETEVGCCFSSTQYFSLPPPSRIIMKFVNCFLPLPLPPCPLLYSLSPPLPSLPLPVSSPPLPISTPPLFLPTLLSPQPPVYTAYASTQWWGRRLECTPSLSVSPDLSGIEVRAVVAQKVTISSAELSIVDREQESSRKGKQ